MSKIAGSSKFAVAVLFLPALFIAVFPGCEKTPRENQPTVNEGPVFIRFDIEQDLEIISLSLFGEPPQLAIWLEDPVTARLQTVFVTYRSGTGDWIGKADCSAALPRWFQVFKQETNSSNLPTMENPAPEAVTGATPTQEQFKTSIEVPESSRWICWIEVNLSGDFNHKYQEYNEIEQTVDWHLSGQPPLIYRAEITATPGETAIPQLFGQSMPYSTAENIIKPVSEDITSAKGIFKKIQIHVIKPDTNVAEKN